MGPALLASLELALHGKPGSLVVICTDGLANIGLGELESDSEESKKFYNDIAAVAKEKGVIISFITIKGEGCKMDILG